MSLHTYLAAACRDMVGLADYLDHLDTATRLRECECETSHAPCAIRRLVPV